LYVHVHGNPRGGWQDRAMNLIIAYKQNDWGKVHELIEEFSQVPIMRVLLEKRGL